MSIVTKLIKKIGKPLENKISQKQDQHSPYRLKEQEEVDVCGVDHLQI